MQIGDLVKNVRDSRLGLVVEQNYSQFLVKWSGRAAQQIPEGTWLYNEHVEIINASR